MTMYDADDNNNLNIKDNYMSEQDELYSGFKHGKIMKRIVRSMYEPWMDDAEKKEFEKILVMHHGEQVDSLVDFGVANGFPADVQEELAMFFVATRITQLLLR